VVSFDDTLGAHMAPPLTEAEPATEDMGRQAVELIVQHCRQPAGAPRRSKRITLQPRIHHRASTRTLAGDCPAAPLASPETAADGM
jgi:LacI family transcriptional regulator